VTATPLAPWLTPEGFSAPRVGAVLREASAFAEAGRFAVGALGRRRSRRRSPSAVRHATPVILVPGFLAGDSTLAPMARVLREDGYRTYRSSIHVNAGCTLNAAAQLESRLESISLRRGTRVQIVGHSLGGMLARGLAVRRPDLVAGIVTLGSPMLAPGAHHASLTRSVEMLVRLSRAGWPGLMSEDCVAGDCARQSFDESRQALPPDVAFTAIYSRRDGIVDWRACVDPIATPVEVTASHAGLAFDPRVIAEVLKALGGADQRS
jgi:pimeloyl-ACP methyl ester carboxylesterase